MAKHEIVIRENTGATSTSAPYLGTYISKETLKGDAYLQQLADLCGLPVIQAQAIIAGSFDALEEMEKETLVRINLDGGAICGCITGSFPTADAAFDPAVNSLVLVFRLDDDVKNALVDITPTIATDETVTKVRLDHVIDQTSPRPYEVIYGTRQFDLFGINLVTSDEGACVQLVNSLGVTFPCTIVSSPSKQHVVAKSNSVIAAGDYKLVVKSRGGDAEGPLQTVYRNVKFIALQTVRIDRVYSGVGEDYGYVHAAEPINIEGLGLTLNAGDDVAYNGYLNGNTVNGHFLASAATVNTDTKLSINYMGETVGDPFGFNNGSTFSLTVHGVTQNVTYVTP